MATLVSPLEVLAFDYVSFIFNNLWTWIAVVTAAVSFWRIRATTTTTISSGGRNDGLTDESTRGQPKPQTKAPLALETKPRVKVTETQDWRALMYNDGVTKGKITVYNVEEIDGERYNDDGKSTVVKYGGGGENGEWWERWERVVRLRNGDEGWYSYLDLTVFNGNVVRLWDANGVRNGGRVSVQRKDFVIDAYWAKL